jgi:hypothetical protein
MDFPEKATLYSRKRPIFLDLEVLSEDTTGKEPLIVYHYENGLKKDSIILNDRRLQDICAVSERYWLQRQSKEAQFKKKIHDWGLLSVINARILDQEVNLDLELDPDTASHQEHLFDQGIYFREHLCEIARRFQKLREHDNVSKTLMHRPDGGAKQAYFDSNSNGYMPLYDSPVEIVRRFKPKREVIQAKIDLLLLQKEEQVISEVKNFLSAATTRKAIDQVQLYHDAFVLYNPGISVGRNLLTRNISLMGFGFLYDLGISVTTVETPFTLALSTRKNIRDMAITLNDHGFKKDEIKEMIVTSEEFEAIGGEPIFKIFKDQGMNFYRKCQLENLLVIDSANKYPSEPKFMREALLASAEKNGTSFFHQVLRLSRQFYRPELFNKDWSTQLEDFCASYGGKVPLWKAFPAYLVEQGSVVAAE